MLVCTYNIRDVAPNVMTFVVGSRSWEITLFVEDGPTRIEKVIENKTKVMLPALLDLCLQELTDMWSELPQVTDAGFEVRTVRTPK